MSSITVSTEASAQPELNPEFSVQQQFLLNHQRQTRQHSLKRVGLNLLGVLLFLLLWESLPLWLSGLNPALLPTPSQVMVAAWPLIHSGELAAHLSASLQRVFLGFFCASVLGISAGVFSARFDLVRYLSEPILHAARAVPSLAIVPLSVLWFGIGETPKVILIVWGAFFPIWIMTYMGVRDVNPIFLRSASTLGASRWDTLFLVILPAALPFILSGLRQALAVSLVILVAAELAGADKGIAYMMAIAHQLFQVPIMFIGLLVLGVLGFVADRLFMMSTARLFPWYQTMS